MTNLSFGGDSLKKFIDLMETHYGTDSEIVLHDLTGDYDKTIVDIRNGHITGRKIGDCGSNLGLEVMRGTLQNGDRFNYITKTLDGKTLRSSTIYLYDDKRNVTGALCVNTDITNTLMLEEYLRDINQYFPKQDGVDGHGDEFFARNISELLDYFIEEGQRIVGKPCAGMVKSDKLQMLSYLDSKGAFLISKSSEKICEALSISKFTLYNYLDILRNGDEKDK